MQTNEARAGFRFQGRYSEADVAALANFSISQILDQRIARATVSATILLAVGAVLLRSWPVAIGGFLAILGVSALLRNVVFPRRLMGQARQTPVTSTLRVISVDGEGIRHQSDGIEQTFPRQDIRRMVLHHSHLFILLKPRGCLMLPLAWIQLPATVEDVVKCLARRGHA